MKLKAWLMLVFLLFFSSIGHAATVCFYEYCQNSDSTVHYYTPLEAVGETMMIIMKEDSSISLLALIISIGTAIYVYLTRNKKEQQSKFSKQKYYQMADI